VLAEVYAHTRKTRGLTVQDLKSPSLVEYMATVALHPIAIPAAEWITDERGAGAQMFIDYLLKPETQAMAMSLGLRPVSKSVPIGDPFTAEWGVLAEMPPIPSFEVPGDDILKRVTDLWLAAKKPAGVMMLIDTSGSMAGDAVDKAKEGAVRFIERMHGRDELEIRTFKARSPSSCRRPRWRAAARPPGRRSPGSSPTAARTSTR
jgi:hypothetical protein